MTKKDNVSILNLWLGETRSLWCSVLRYEGAVVFCQKYTDLCHS